jgi:uncharacterized repeat protein (TIGR01451 family)
MLVSNTRHHPRFLRNCTRLKRRAQRQRHLGLELLELRAVPSLTSGTFEIDGNAIDNTPGTGTGILPAKLPAPDDWANIYRSLGGTGAGSSLTPPTKSSDGPGTFDNAVARTFVSDPAATDSTYFTTGGSKDVNDITSWAHSTQNVAPDKTDLTDAYAAGYIDPVNNHGYVYFGSNRFDTSGASQVAFWFFRNQVVSNPNGTFTDASGNPVAHVAGTVDFTNHKILTAGDFLVLSSFSQGGTVPTIQIFMWVGGKNGSSTQPLLNTSITSYKLDGALQLVFDATAQGTTDANGDGIADVTAQVNTAAVPASDVPWASTDKNGSHGFDTNAFFEGGIDLTSLGLGSGCLSSFLAESRSSGPGLSSQLKDYALGNFQFCFVEAEGGQDVSKVGDAATYTITLTNTGAGTLWLQNVTDVTGAGAGNTTLGNIVLNGVVQTAPLGETFTVPAGALDGLAPNETQTITVTRITKAGDPDPIVTNTHTVLRETRTGTSPNFTFGGATITHDATNTVDLFAPAVLITKTADKTAAKVGDTITYTFTIQNRTDGDLTTPVGAFTTVALAGTNVNTITVKDASGFANNDVVYIGTVGTRTITSISSDGNPATNDTITFSGAAVTVAVGDQVSKGIDGSAPDLTLGAWADNAQNQDKHTTVAVAGTNVTTIIVVDPSVLAVGDTVLIGDPFGTNVTRTITNIGGDGDPTTKDIEVNAPVTVAVGNDVGVFLGGINDTLLGDLSGSIPAALKTLSLNESGSFTVQHTVTTADFTKFNNGPLTNTVTAYYEPLGFPNNITSTASKSVDLVDAYISIAPTTATNEVGKPHTFTVTVHQVINGVSSLATVGNVDVTLTDSNGAASVIDTAASTADDNQPDGDNLDNNGQSKLVFTSATAGQVKGHATASLTVDGVPLTVATDGSTTVSGNSNSGDATKTFVDATIQIAGTKTNEVGVDHTFTATVQVNDGSGAGFVNAPDGTKVLFVIQNTNGASAKLDATADENGDGIFDNDQIATTTGGVASVTINSSTAGKVIANAYTYTTAAGVNTPLLSVGGVGLVRDTDTGTSAKSGPSTTDVLAGAATKTYVDATIQIAGTKTNEVGKDHTFTATVQVNDGSGAGFVNAPDGTKVLFVIQNTNGASAKLDATADENGDGIFDNDQIATTTGGVASVTINSSTTGQVIANAYTYTTAAGVNTPLLSVGGVGLVRDTDTGTSAKSGPSTTDALAGAATKTYVDASIALSPLTAENPVLKPHTVTATVKQDDGLTAAQGGDGVTGLANAPDGTKVVFTVDPGTATIIYTDPNLDLDNNPLTANTVNGQATLQFTSSTPGTVTINASTTFLVGGVSLIRDTDPSTVNIPAGPGGSGPAQKVFIGFPDLHIEKSATTLAGDPITDPIAQGDQFRYVLHVHNDGNAIAHNVTVNDDLDNRLSIISVTVNGSPGSFIADPGDPGDPNHIIITVGDLARDGQPGDAADIVITVDTGEPGQDCLYTTNFATVFTPDPETPSQLHGGTPGESDNTSNTVVVTTTETFQTILFDPDGSGPLTPVEVAVFDQAVGNSLQVGALPGVNNVGGTDFRVVFQSKLSALFDENSNALSIPGLGTTFQILTETNFTAHGSPAGTSSVTFSNPTGSGPNTFQLIYHPIGTALNDRTGAGYAFNAANGDVVILTGHISQIVGGSITGSTAGNLDQAAGAPPAGPTNPPTARVSGSSTLEVTIDTVNPAFFPDDTEQLTALNVQSQNVAPFFQVGANSGTFFEGTSRNIGATNGISGPDIELQTDANTSLTVLCVPLNEAGVPAVNSAGQPLVDLGITKNDGVDAVTVGSSTTYTITVSNAGPAAALGAPISDIAPANTSGDTWTFVSATGGGSISIGSPSSGTNNLSTKVDLPAGATVTFSFTAKNVTGSSLANTATVTAPSGVSDTNANNNSDTDTDTVGNPVLAVSPGSGSGATSLTEQQLQPVLSAAIAGWAGTGLSLQSLSTLQNVTVHIGNLQDDVLGLAAPSLGQIWISQNAAGWGWWTNPSAAPTLGRIDLLTVLEHELGHLLGFEHSNGPGLMEASLAGGMRLTPGAVADGSNLGVPLLGTSNLVSTPTSVAATSVAPMVQAVPSSAAPISLAPALLASPWTANASALAVPGYPSVTASPLLPEGRPVSSAVPLVQTAVATAGIPVLAPGAFLALPPTAGADTRPTEYGGDPAAFPYEAAPFSEKPGHEALPVETPASETGGSTDATAWRQACDAYLADEDWADWLTTSERKAAARAESEAEGGPVSLNLAVGSLAALAGLIGTVGHRRATASLPPTCPFGGPSRSPAPMTERRRGLWPRWLDQCFGRQA